MVEKLPTSLTAYNLCKIHERLIFNGMFVFLIENCISQLLCITHVICKSFDDRFEVCGVFLDISKTFNNVWHKGHLTFLINFSDKKDKK